MGYIWTQQLKKAVETGAIFAPPTLDVRVLLMTRSPMLTQEKVQIDFYRPVTTVASLLALPGWEEVVDPLYRHGINTGCTLLSSGANTFVQMGQDSTPFTLSKDTQVEAVVLALLGNAIGIPPATQRQTAVAQGSGFNATIVVSTVTNSPKAGIAAGMAVAYDATCLSDNEYVVFAVDTPFRVQDRVVFRPGDALSAQIDSLTGVRWMFGWATGGGEVNALAEGPLSLLMGPPVFESAHVQKVWMFPQRVNYIANPSFEYSGGFWQSNRGALGRAVDATAPSPNVGITALSSYTVNADGSWTVSGSYTPTISTPQYSPADRLYLRSAEFFPSEGLMTFQLLAKGRGVLRVGLASYSRDYMSQSADWGMKDDLVFEEWELSPDTYTRVEGLRTMDDFGYEASLVIEVRGTLESELLLENGSNLLLEDGSALLLEGPVYSAPYVLLDRCIVEEGALLEWAYFDGDETYGGPDDYLWYGDKVGTSYSLWYNNRRDINGRLFGRRVDDTALYTSRDEQLDSMLSGWVPAGTAIAPQWGALGVNDTYLLPPDKSSATLAVDLWPEQSQFFNLVQIVGNTPTSITMLVSGEGGYPISRAFVRSNSTVFAATISTRPWEQPGLRSLEIDALKAELYDLSKAQEVTITWPAVPAFASNTLFVERGNSRSPQSYLVYTLQSAAGSGFGEASIDAFGATVTSRPTVATATATGTASTASTAYGALAVTAESTGTGFNPGQNLSFAAETATAIGQGQGALAEELFPFPAGAASATGTATTNSARVNATTAPAEAIGTAFNPPVSVRPSSTTGIGSGAADNASIVKNDAPNPVTGLAASYQTSGSDTWNAVASWTLPGDPDLSKVQVRWTINAVVGSWIDLLATATGHTQAATSGVTHTVEVRTVDTNNQVSTTAPSLALGSSPLNAVPSLTVTQVNLDQLQVTWTHPSGNNRSAYTVVWTDFFSPTTTTESAATTTKTITVTPTVSWFITVTPQDNTSGTRNGRSKTTTAAASAGTPSLSLTSWTYSSVDLSWTSVPFASTYEVERAVGGGAYSVIATGLTGTTYTASGLSQDTNYRFRVRAKGAVYFGPYSNEARPAIGHPASSYTQAWSSTNNSVNLYLNHPDGVYVPANVTTTYLGVNLTCTFSTGLFSGTGTRSANYVAADAVGFGVGTQSNPWNVPLIAFAVSTPGLCGIQVFGSGWSSSPTGGFRATGTISMIGDETIYISEVFNSYW